MTRTPQHIAEQREYALSLGTRLRKERTRAGQTQREVSEALGVHWNTVQAWETGGRLPNAFHMMHIRRLLRQLKAKKPARTAYPSADRGAR